MDVLILFSSATSRDNVSRIMFQTMRIGMADFLSRTDLESLRSIKGLTTIPKSRYMNIKDAMQMKNDYRRQFVRRIEGVVVKDIPKIRDFPNVKYIKFHKFCWPDWVLRPGDLPDGITHLDVGRLYNGVIKPGALPKSLTHLTLGVYYNQEIAQDVFHEGLTHLKVGELFSILHIPSLIDILPDSLTNFKLSSRYLQFKRNIPQNITTCYY